MKHLLFGFLSIVSVFNSKAQDTLVVIAETINSPTILYKDSEGLWQDRKLSEGTKVILIGAKNDYMIFKTVVDGAIGYIKSYELEYEKLTAEKLTNTNLDWKKNKADRIFKLFDELQTMREKRDSIGMEIREMDRKKKGKRFGFLVTDFQLTGNDYSKGFDIVFENWSDKSVKYVYTTVSAYNAVGDIVATKIATSVGPIEAERSGTYRFENTFFSKVIDRLKITKLRVVYKDGSDKIFTGNILKAVLLN